MRAIGLLVNSLNSQRLCLDRQFQLILLIIIYCALIHCIVLINYFIALFIDIL